MKNIEWYWAVLYLLVMAAFTSTLYISIKAAIRQKHDEAEAHRLRFVSRVSAALIASVWPVSLPICVVLATAAIMSGRER
jgi:hypothetical protein